MREDMFYNAVVTSAIYYYNYLTVAEAEGLLAAVFKACCTAASAYYNVDVTFYNSSNALGEALRYYNI